MIVYIGNMLSSKGNSVSVIETLSPALSKRFKIISSSSYKNQFLRMIDMAYTVYFNRKVTNVVLIDTYSSKAFYYALIISFLCRILKIKYIPILHGGDFPNRLRNSVFLSKMIFKNSECNITPSLYLKFHFTEMGYNVKYIPNSVDLNLFRFKLRTECAPSLLWVRAFHRTYNPTMAIQVVALLKKKYPNVRLCMVGSDKDGSLDEAKRLAKDLGVMDSVEFLGGLSRVEWSLLSSRFDIFINTTNFDNMPLSVIEAMALGLVIVSTNVGGLPFLLDNGVDSEMVDPNDAIGMAEKITYIIETKGLCISYINKARKKAEDLSWEHIEIEWIKLLKNYEKAI